MLAAVDTSSPSNFFFFFCRQLISLCKFQRVQIVNVLNVLYFLKRGHWSCRDCVQSTAGVPQTLRSRVTKLFLEEDAGLLALVCNLKTKQLLLDLGMVLKWDNLLTSLSTDSVRNTHHEEWPLLSEIRQPKSAASSKKYKSRRIFLKHLFCSFVDLALWQIGFTHQDVFCFKIKQIITKSVFFTRNQNDPL